MAVTIKKVDVEWHPVCPFQQGESVIYCGLLFGEGMDYSSAVCSEKAPKECPIRGGCVIVVPEDE